MLNTTIKKNCASCPYKDLKCPKFCQLSVHCPKRLVKPGLNDILKDERQVAKVFTFYTN